MKSKNIIPITILALFYLVIIAKTVILYYSQLYFPDLDYITQIHIINQQFLPYFGTIKILMAIIALILIPGFLMVKRDFKEMSENIPIYLIILFSSVSPLLALINNFITGDYQFSMVLLVYGILFTILAFRLDN